MYTPISKYTDHFLCGEKYNLTGVVISGSNHRKLNAVARQKIAQQAQPEENNHLYISFAGAEKPLVDKDQYMAALFAAFGLSFRDLPAIVLTADPDSCESIVLSFNDSTQLSAYLDELQTLAATQRTNQEFFAKIGQNHNIKSLYIEQHCIQLSTLMQMVSSLFNCREAEDTLISIKEFAEIQGEEQQKEFAAIADIFTPLYKKIAEDAKREEQQEMPLPENTFYDRPILKDGDTLYSLTMEMDIFSRLRQMERPLRLFSERTRKFELSKDEMQWMEEESRYFYKAYSKLAKVRGVEEFSPFCSYLHNILEIEINATVLQLMRQFMGIEMPKWYCKYCPNKRVYIKTKHESVNLNRYKEGTPRRYVSPGFGKVYYAMLELCKNVQFRQQMQDYFHNNMQGFINAWYKIFIQRNEESHTTSMNKQDYLYAVALMNEIFRNYSDSFRKMKKDLMTV